MKRKFYFDIIPLVFSLLFAGIWIFLGGFLFKILLNNGVFTPLVVALYITGLAGCLLLSIVVSNAVCNSAKPNASAYKKTFIVILALFLCTMLFEFLYELDMVSINLTKPTSYIFLIDNSGSMSLNDPDYVRNDAIYEVMKDCDNNFPFAVYSFDDDCKQISGIKEAKEVENKDYGFETSGGTDIEGAIEYVLDDIDSNVLVGVGASPRILLLSDGVSDFYNYQGMVDECNDKNVSISTIGIGGADSRMLEQIARDTRGAFIWVDNVGNLSSAMNTAATTFTSFNRNLLDYRPTVDNDALYAIMRIVFMIVIAAGFVLIKVFMFSTFDSNNIALYTFIALAAIGALSLEIGCNMLFFLPGAMRIVMCVFFILLFGTSKNDNSQMYLNQNGYPGYNQGMNNMGPGFAGAGDKWGF